MFKLLQISNTMSKLISRTMYRIVSTLSFCLTLAFLSNAQLPIYQGDFEFLNQKDSIKNNSYASLITESYFNSNAITNGFIDKILGDGYIDNSYKQQVSERLKDQNRLGAIIDVTLLYKHKLKNFTLVSALRGKNYRQIEFSKDMFEVLMYGNKAFEDQSAMLAKTRQFQTVSEEIYLGGEKYLDSLRLLIGGGIGFQNISYAQNKTLSRGSLYTAPQGRYLDFDGQYSHSETSREGSEFTRNVGWGTTINLYAIKKLKNNNRLAIELKDFGFLKVNNTRSYEVDSSYHFEGIQANEFFNFSEATIFNPEEDDFNDLLGTTQEKSKSTYMSTASIHVSYFHNISSKIYFYAGVKQLFPAPYIPLIYIKPFYKVKQYLEVGPNVSYGGFGNLDVGLSFKGVISKRFFYTYDFLFLEDLLVKDSSSGQGFNFSLSALF